MHLLWCHKPIHKRKKPGEFLKKKYEHNPLSTPLPLFNYFIPPKLTNKNLEIQSPSTI